MSAETLNREIDPIELSQTYLASLSGNIVLIPDRLIYIDRWNDYDEFAPVDVVIKTPNFSEDYTIYRGLIGPIRGLDHKGYPYLTGIDPDSFAFDPDNKEEQAEAVGAIAALVFHTIEQPGAVVVNSQEVSPYELLSSLVGIEVSTPSYTIFVRKAKDGVGIDIKENGESQMYLQFTEDARFIGAADEFPFRIEDEEISPHKSYYDKGKTLASIVVKSIRRSDSRAIRRQIEENPTL